MGRTLIERPIIPVASENDAEATAEAVIPYLRDVADRVIVLNVIEKAGGAPDKASIGQREDYAENVFTKIVPALESNGFEVETRIAYGTDVADTIVDVAREADATAIVFVSRGSGVFSRVLSGDVEHRMTTKSDRPVVALPRTGGTG